MIKFIQKYMKSIVLTLISFLIAFSMLGFGVDFFGGRNGDYVAKVDGEKISREELRKLRDDLEARYKAAWGPYYQQAAEMLNLDLDKEARENLVPVFLVNRAAKDLGFVLGDYGVSEKIRGMFPEGKIDLSLYENFLRSRRQTAHAFEAELKRTGGSAQLESVIQELSLASKAEAMKMMEEDDTTFDIQYVEFNPEDFVKKVEEPKEEDLQKYYEDNANNYERKAQASYKYITFSPDKFLDIVELAPEDLEIYYTEHERDFTTPDTATVQLIKVRAAEVKKDENANAENGVKEEEKTAEEKQDDENLLKEKQKAAQDEAKANAEKALEELKNGGDFTTIAKPFLSKEEAKDDKAFEAITVRRGDRFLPPAVTKAIFDFAKEGYPEIVEDRNTYYVIKINEFKAKEVEPFEKVKDSIELILRRQAAPAWVYDYAHGLFDEWNKSKKDLGEFAGEKTLEVKESEGLLEAGKNPADVYFNLTENVLKFPGEKKQIVEVGKNLALVQIAEYREAYLPEFAEVKDEVKADYVKQQSVVLAKKAADDVVANFSDGSITDLTSALKGEKVEVKDAKEKKLQALPSPLNNEEIKSELSAVGQIKTAPKASHMVDGKYYVAQVVNIVKPDLATVEKEKLAEYREKASNRNAKELMDMLIKQMKMASEIEERL